MPSLAHLVLGATFALSLYSISNGKFTKYHAFILFMNNYLGPDVGWVLGVGNYTHTFLFYPLFAFFLAMFYHYFTKFSLYLEGIKEIELVELEKPQLAYVNVYFLVVAGGIMHNYLDSIFNRGGVFLLIPEIKNSHGFVVSIQDFMDIWHEPAVHLNIFFSALVGILFIFGFIYIFVWFLKNNTLRNMTIPIVYLVAFLIFFYLAGSVATLHHADAGAIFYIALIWLPVMACITLSVKEFSLSRKSRKVREKREHPKHLLRFLSLWFLLGALVAIVGSIFGFIFNDAIISWIFCEWGEMIREYLTLQEVISLALGIEIFLLIIGVVNLLCAYGLLLRKRKLWRITIYYQLSIGWTLIGLFTACLLSKDSIKEQFVT